MLTHWLIEPFATGKKGDEIAYADIRSFMALPAPTGRQVQEQRNSS